MNPAARYLGLISGTSVDGIDAALVHFDDADGTLHCVVEAACTYPLEDTLRAEILRVSQADARIALDDFGALDTAIGIAFAEAADRLLRDADIDASQVAAIGSHGQTLRHRPHGVRPFTMQIGDPNTIAERTGITTVADFRRRDVAAGGQGAPLVPAFHAALFHSHEEDRAVLNLGGIANLTLLPKHGEVRGFDTGPANGLMDAWCLRHRGVAFDDDGEWAASGNVQSTLLEKLLQDPWLRLPPPKSTGRDQYHLDWLDAQLSGLDAAAVDVQATLCAFSARSIAEALQATQSSTERVIVCGGGVRNGRLMRMISLALPGKLFAASDVHGLDSDFVEAAAFAWLARETLHQRPGNLAAVTGARGPRVLGAVFPA